MVRQYDVVVVGGGINGCGCAQDAASRGLSVLLCEKDDLASKTSSSSTKLIHGGLRYLEYYNFKLVKKALDERQTLLKIAPHLVHPLPIMLPHKKTMRPIWMLYCGLLMYDYLSRKNQLPHSKLMWRRAHPSYFASLARQYNKGFLYFDAITDDARLTVANAMQAKQAGAVILTRTELVDAHAWDNQWQLTLQPQAEPAFQIKANVIINAAGPWAPKLDKVLQTPRCQAMSLVKGSHIVVHQLYAGEHAYMLQHDDHRVVFVIPYHHHTLIGTTDLAFDGDPATVSINEQEVRYLCDLVNQYFQRKISAADIICSWSGVRPLLREADKAPSALSRDYAYHFSRQPAPLVTIYSGKITTYRQLSQAVIDTLVEIFPQLPPSDTSHGLLPGAVWQHMDYTAYRRYAWAKYHWLPESLLTRYLQNYGTQTELLLDGRHSLDDLGEHFTANLYQNEVDYLCHYEWARAAEDILWRRTKLGLTTDPEGQQRLAKYLAEKHYAHST